MRGLCPVDAAVGGFASAEIIAGSKVLRNARRVTRDQRGQAAVEHSGRGGRHFLEHVRGGVIGKYGHCLLIDNIAGIGFGGHVMQSGASLSFAVDHRPVHRHASAVFGQQRTVHIERAARGYREQRRFQHVAVVERKQEIGLQRADAVDGVREIGIIRCDCRYAVLRGERGHALEPDFFVGIVVVRDDQGYVDFVREQYGQTLAAYIVIGEDDGRGHF